MLSLHTCKVLISVSEAGALYHTWSLFPLVGVFCVEVPRLYYQIKVFLFMAGPFNECGCGGTVLGTIVNNRNAVQAIGPQAGFAWACQVVGYVGRFLSSSRLGYYIENDISKKIRWCPLHAPMPQLFFV